MPKESDWKFFWKCVPGWRERYLRAKNQEIVGLLTDEGKTPTEQFWGAQEKIKDEARILVDCLDGHSRSKMFQYLFSLYRHGFVEEADLEGFSNALRDQILQLSSAFDR